jgi:N6-L-threonylcarbamoyladenine synthase
MKLFRDQNDVASPAFVVAGGVAANQALRAALTATAETNGFTLKAPPLKYCTDNAAMIALAGLEHYEKLGKGALPDTTSGMSTIARPRWPLDETSAANAPIHKYAGRKGAKA